MGYNTDFFGRFLLNAPLSEAQAAYLTAFAETRRMQRSPKLAVTLPDPKRLAVGLPIGDDAGYFVGGAGMRGQGDDPAIRNYNVPPHGQPGLWCLWIPSEDRCGIEWDGTEKFYQYREWLEYLITHFIRPWGFSLRGRVGWRGEGANDVGVLVVIDNEVNTQPYNPNLDITR